MALDIEHKEERRKQAPSLNSIPDGMIIAEDSGRTQYQPQVRILRRDTKGPCFSSQNLTNSTETTSNSKLSKHSKSLQQREAEYAQARLRIFGYLAPDDDDDGDSEACDESPIVYGSSIQNQSSAQIIKPDPTSPHIAVLRQPKGPDGTAGFTKPHPT
ncbi:unnamed protein product [Candidula unifasciata]|uniref:SUZ RNA-binding domain-containing n=1 Tax=Candidula unifasciata TaxID=100452 RepID=A0A8S3YTG8_9EUPU|nr:unnamed protein product [Candidula unifasciata]